MTELTRQRFLEIMNTLAGVFDNELTEAKVSGYWLALRKLSDEELTQAAGKAIEQCKFFPKPAELLEFRGGIPVSARAAKAFEIVREKIGSIGTYASVDFDDKAINATIRNMGGWIALGNMDAEEFRVWGRKEFEKIYTELTRSGVTQDAGEHLPGRSELENQRNGLALVPPKVIVTGLVVDGPKRHLRLVEGGV